MIGKKVKINTGLFRGYEGTVESSFMSNGQEVYVVSFVRSLTEGLSKTTATVRLDQVTIL